MNIRNRIEMAFSYHGVEKPVYAVYDWFVKNRDIDWQSLFRQGLGQINHANLVSVERPNLNVVERVSVENGKSRRDVTWITDKGRLHEFYIDGWRQEYLIKSPDDYNVLAHALSGSRYIQIDDEFDVSESKIGDAGITLGQFNSVGYNRTPFQIVQIDLAGLERFSIDIALQSPELLELLELMNSQLLDIFKVILKSKATHIKLWENLSIETMGPSRYKTFLVPLYKKICDISNGSGKKLHVHYDGKLALIADEIAKLPFEGIDSLTPPPEGDLTIKQARKYWPDKFFWLHPTLDWDGLSNVELAGKIKQTANEAGMRRFCFELSEELPPNWQRTIPVILETLNDIK